MQTKKIFLIVTALFLVLGCGLGQRPILPILKPTPTVTYTPSALPTATFVPTSTIPPEPTFTPDPYGQYRIDYLRARPYGEGKIEIIQTMGANESFTRYLVRYTSDGLNIHALMTEPVGEGPFPVIILLHGYSIPANYSLLAEPLDTDDAFAQQGYLVLHPALRNYSPSDSGDNLFRVGHAIDVLNLIALVRSQGGGEGALVQADPDRVGLWGFSMGGGIALRVLTITSDVDAAMLYSPISGDETKNIALFSGLAGGYDSQFAGEANVPESQLVNISASHYYSAITSPLLIFHGSADSVVPVSWTVESCDLLRAAGKNPDCIFYEGAAHTFVSRYLQDLIPRMFEFYDQYLRQ
jgi:dipeptidyl aminopeptidase/acylaminoacyl peptidase